MTLARIQTDKGFTLIELLVVISIISLLSSIVLASLNEARTKAKNVATIENARQASLALLLESDNGVFLNLTGRHCLTVNCIIKGGTEPQSGQIDFVAQRKNDQRSIFAQITENLLFIKTAQAQGAVLRQPQQTEKVSGLPGGVYQGMFYYTPNEGRDAYLFYPLKGVTTCLSGYVALTGNGANGVLCGEKVGESQREKPSNVDPVASNVAGSSSVSS